MATFTPAPILPTYQELASIVIEQDKEIARLTAELAVEKSPSHGLTQENISILQRIATNARKKLITDGPQVRSVYER